MQQSLPPSTHTIYTNNKQARQLTVEQRCRTTHRFNLFYRMPFLSPHKTSCYTTLTDQSLQNTTYTTQLMHLVWSGSPLLHNLHNLFSFVFHFGSVFYFNWQLRIPNFRHFSTTRSAKLSSEPNNLHRQTLAVELILVDSPGIWHGHM